MSTPERSASRSRMSRPPSVVRLTVMLRLPRFGSSRNGFGPASAWLSRLRSPRCGSPVGGSTLRTSAPRSAMIAPAPGTNVHAATSMTRTPSNGPLMAGALAGPGQRERVQAVDAAGVLDHPGGVGDVVIRNDLVPLLQRHGQPLAGEVGAEAAVRPGAERDVPGAAAVEVNLLRARVRLRVPAGHAERERHHVAGLDRAAVELEIPGRPPRRLHDR